MNDSTTTIALDAAYERFRLATSLASQEAYRYDYAEMNGRAVSTLARLRKNSDKAQVALKGAQMAFGNAIVADMEANPVAVVEQPEAPAEKLGDAEGREVRVLNALTSEPRHIDAIAKDAGLWPTEAAATLLLLELKRQARRLPGGMFEAIEAEQPMPEQQQAEALPVEVADRMRAEQDYAATRARWSAKQLKHNAKRAAFHAAQDAPPSKPAECLNCADTLPAGAHYCPRCLQSTAVAPDPAFSDISADFEAEMSARDEDAEFDARNTFYTVAHTMAEQTRLDDLNQIAHSPSGQRPDYKTLRHADMHEWNAASGLLRRTMAEARMKEENRIAGAGKYLQIAGFRSFKQATPAELHSLRYAILRGHLTQDWEQADTDEEPAIAQPLGGCDAEDFERILNG